jgi:hypothetical protein
MAPADAGEVREFLEAVARYDREGGVYPRGGPVALAALGIVARHLRRGSPLELPPAVAAANRGGPFNSDQDLCEGCDYALPMRWRRCLGDGTVEPAVHFFKRCPLCGAHVRPRNSGP